MSGNILGGPVISAETCRVCGIALTGGDGSGRKNLLSREISVCKSPVACESLFWTG